LYHLHRALLQMLKPSLVCFGCILLVHQIGDSTWSLNKTKLWGLVMKLSLLLAASQRKVQAEIEYKCAKQSLWIWITQQSFLPQHIFNITGDWLGLLHFKIASYFQFLHAGVKGIMEPCKAWALEDVNFGSVSSTLSIPMSTAYQIDTIWGIGFSISTSYFCNEFDQPELEQNLRHLSNFSKHMTLPISSMYHSLPIICPTL